MGEADCPPRMDGRVEPLGGAVSEKRAEFAERPGKTAHTVAVFHEEAPSVEFRDHRAVVESKAYLIWKVVGNPDVVVAFEPGNLHTGVGQFGEGAEEACETAGDNGAVFPPVVKDVAEEEEAFAVGRDMVQEVDHSLLMRARVLNI